MEKATQFVTVLYGVLNINSGEFRYARAGHEPPLILSPDSSVERLPHKPGLAPGSTLLLYTDGMTDCRDPNGEPFGLERIQRNFSRCSETSAQEICDHLLRTLKKYQQGSKQDDDVTLVAVHAKL